jgi:very-short-patch-repair endonuclease
MSSPEEGRSKRVGLRRARLRRSAPEPPRGPAGRVFAGLDGDAADHGEILIHHLDRRDHAARQPLAGKAIACKRVLPRGAALANENARALRKRLTPQEVKLWVRLRELKTLGFHFRRQAPVGRYIVDFVSFRSQLIIEADGGQHGMPEGARSDQARDAFLQLQGFRVLRFWNSDIDANLTGVMESILRALRDASTD